MGSDLRASGAQTKDDGGRLEWSSRCRIAPQALVQLAVQFEGVERGPGGAQRSFGFVADF
jgi:hypothetical protein